MANRLKGAIEMRLNLMKDVRKIEANNTHIADYKNQPTGPNCREKMTEWEEEKKSENEIENK